MFIKGVNFMRNPIKYIRSFPKFSSIKKKKVLAHIVSHVYKLNLINDDDKFYTQKVKITSQQDLDRIIDTRRGIGLVDIKDPDKVALRDLNDLIPGKEYFFASDIIFQDPIKSFIPWQKHIIDFYELEMGEYFY
jgi:YHS domain-containing protein